MFLRKIGKLPVSTPEKKDSMGHVMGLCPFLSMNDCYVKCTACRLKLSGPRRCFDLFVYLISSIMEPKTVKVTHQGGDQSQTCLASARL